MGFRQLYYTSCERGLAGYGGFQFNAVTPGVPQPVLREVEARTVYEPPRSLPGDPPAERLGEYPLVLSHNGSAGGTCVTAQVAFVGPDYSGRPGNYFAHALVTDDPERDFGDVLPVELWEAPLWRRTPVDDPDLPELAGPPPRGVIDRPGVQAFLDGAGPAADALPPLLTAVDRAMAGDRSVLLAGRGSAANAWWIAAVSYLLGERAARRLSFTTYSHRPAQSRHHVIGVVDPPPRDLGFRLFDPAAGRLPEVEPHPLAVLLGRIGVLPAGSLWPQAAALAGGAEEGFDGWYGVVAAAAALLGLPMAQGDADAAADWLVAGAKHLPARHAEAVLGALLNRDGGGDGVPYDEARLRGLAEMAGGTGAAAAERLQTMLVDRALPRVERGEPAEPVPLTAPGARDRALRRCLAAVDGAPPRIAAAVLGWAEESGLALPEPDLERCGQALDPAAPAEELAAVLRGRPAAVRGLVARLAGDIAAAEHVLAGPVADLIGRDDLAGHPALAERWLLAQAARDRLPPLRALDEIGDVRRSAGRAPVDAGLLERLWPAGCPPGDLMELLAVADAAEERAPRVRDWFVAEIQAAARAAPAPRHRPPGWPELAAALAGRRILAALPEPVRWQVHQMSRIGPLLRLAADELAAGRPAGLRELYEAYGRGDEKVRARLDHDLPGLLLRSRRPGGALRGCPDGLYDAFCAEVRRALPRVPGDERAERLAATLFGALLDVGETGDERRYQQLEHSIERIRGWGRRSGRNIARLLEEGGADAEDAELFKRWREEAGMRSRMPGLPGLRGLRGRIGSLRGGRDAGRDADRDGDRDSGREGGRDGGRDPGREGGRDAGREGGWDAGREGGRDSGREGGRDDGRGGGRDGGRDGGWDAGREGGRDDGRDGGTDGGRDGGRDSGREGGRGGWDGGSDGGRDGWPDDRPYGGRGGRRGDR